MIIPPGLVKQAAGGVCKPLPSHTSRFTHSPANVMFLVDCILPPTYLWFQSAPAGRAIANISHSIPIFVPQVERHPDYTLATCKETEQVENSINELPGFLTNVWAAGRGEGAAALGKGAADAGKGAADAGKGAADAIAVGTGAAG